MRMAGNFRGTASIWVYLALLPFPWVVSGCAEQCAGPPLAGQGRLRRPGGMALRATFDL